jgi:hypothetical protein
MTDMNILGIDPGKGGGICFLGPGDVVQIGTMVEGKQLYEYLVEVREQHGPFICFLERVSSWRGELDEAPGKRFGLDKMLANYNKIINTLELADVPYIFVSPVTWQRHLKAHGASTRSLRNPKNGWKAFAIEKYPRKFKLITLRTADAVCIAWYGKQVSSSQPREVYKKLQNKGSLKLI